MRPHVRGAAGLVGQPGLSLWLRADGDEWVTLTVYSSDAEGATPFEAGGPVSGEWTQLSWRWEQFAKPDWVGDDGLAALDLTHMAGYGLTLGGGEGGAQGALRVDDVALLAGGAPAVATPEPAAGTAAEPTVVPLTEQQRGEHAGGRCAGALALPVGVVLAGLAGRRSRRSKVTPSLSAAEGRPRRQA